jgi:hypothetical protein
MNDISGIDGLFRPFRGSHTNGNWYPRLTPWAIFFRRYAAKPREPPFDQPYLSCYKDWFCAGPPVRRLIKNWRPLRYKISDAAKLNTPVQCRVVEACSELRQCAPRRSQAERPVGAVRWVAVPKHVMALK